MSEENNPQNQPRSGIFNLTCPNNEIITGGVIESGINITSITNLKCGGKSIDFEKQGESSRAYNLPICNKGYDGVQYVVTVDQRGNETLVNSIRLKCKGDKNPSGEYGRNNLTSRTKNLRAKSFTCPAGTSLRRFKGNYHSLGDNKGAWTSLNLDETDCLPDSKTNVSTANVEVAGENSSSTTTSTTTTTSMVIDNNMYILAVVGIIALLLLIMFIFR